MPGIVSGPSEQLEDHVPEGDDKRPARPKPVKPKGGRDPAPRPPDLPPLPDFDDPGRPVVPKPDKV
jgi:hypothetical protein